MTGGRGWIALAIVTCAMWKPSAAMITAYVFGGMEALAYQLQAISIAVSPVLLKMLPYLATVIVLVIVSIANRKKGVTGPEAMTFRSLPRTAKKEVQSIEQYDRDNGLRRSVSA